MISNKAFIINLTPAKRPLFRRRWFKTATLAITLIAIGWAVIHATGIPRETETAPVAVAREPLAASVILYRLGQAPSFADVGELK
jgi:hypothetical protein